MGLPSATTPLGGIPRMIEDEVTGCIVDAGDSRTLADRMIDLLRDRTMRDKMGRAARETAKRRFAADRVVEQTIRVYHDLLLKKEI